MPTFAEMLAPASRKRIDSLVPDMPSYEELNAEREANLERIAAQHSAALLDLPGVAEALEPDVQDDLAAMCGEMDAEDAEREAIRSKLTSTLPAQTPVAPPRQPSYATPTKEVTVPQPRGSQHTINLSHLSDAQLGRMVRAALLTLVVDELPAQLAEALGQREQAAVLVKTQHDAEMAERQAHPELWTHDGFTIGTQVIPALDLRDVILGELAPAKTRSPYNRTLYSLGLPTLDAETTTWADIREAHKMLADHKPQPVAPTETTALVVAEIDDSTKAKIAALADVLGISKKAAAKRLKEMSA